MMKEKNGENKKAGKNWMDDEILHWLQGEMKLEFLENARKQSIHLKP